MVTPDEQALADLLCEHTVEPMWSAIVVARSILASEWMTVRDAEQRRQGAAEALGRFADTRGVNIGDEDDAWWRGYRQAQREAILKVRDEIARLRATGRAT